MRGVAGRGVAWRGVPWRGAAHVSSDERAAGCCGTSWCGPATLRLKSTRPDQTEDAGNARGVSLLSAVFASERVVCFF